MILSGQIPKQIWCVESVQKQDLEWLNGLEITVIPTSEMKLISDWVNPEGILAIFSIPEQKKFNYSSGWVLVADRIQDPGNLGTMYRILDWFGGSQIILLKGSVDCFNSKVVQSSMGAVGVLDTYQMTEKELLGLNLPLAVASMEGNSIYSKEFELTGGLIVFGNESQGVSSELRLQADLMLTIPGGKTGQESLNVGVSAGIIYGQLAKT